MAKRMNRPEARQQRRERRARNRDEANFRRQIAAEANSIAPSIKASQKPIKPLTEAQRLYDAAMHASQIVFGVGPAGTGKTWLAAVRAADLLRENLIEKIIVTRPAVEAGEKLGFLPGDIDEKYDPYFRPVRDALIQRLGSSHVEALVRSGRIEARPLAHLRGATIDNAWVIADEMQNATPTQFKMLLSRIGENAKFIVNGDPRQTDLPAGQSGLADAVKRLRGKPGIGVVYFGREDIVRSGLCQIVVEAYENEGAGSADELIEPADAGLQRVFEAGQTSTFSQATR